MSSNQKNEEQSAFDFAKTDQPGQAGPPMSPGPNLPAGPAGAELAKPANPFALIAGLHGEQPHRLSIPHDTTALERAAKIELHGSKQTEQWLQGYLALDENNLVARAQYAACAALQLGGVMAVHLARVLRAGVALYLLVADGLWENFVEAGGEQRFSCKNEFIKAFLSYYRISDAKDQVSRLLATAELWVAIFRAPLPCPPVLSRLNRLVTLDSLAEALALYGELVQQSGGKVPTLEQIEAAVDRHRCEKAFGKGPKKRDGRSWVGAVRLELQAAREQLVREQPDVAAAIVLLDRACQVLATHAAKKQKRKAPSRQTVVPTKPCPVSWADDGQSIVIDASGATAEVVAAIAEKAPSLPWQQQSAAVWRLALPAGESEGHAKRAQAREWLTRVLEHFGCMGPSAQGLAA